MSNVVICHISVALNVIFDGKSGCKNIQRCRKYKMEEVWTKLKNKFDFSGNQSKNIRKRFTKMSITGLSMESSAAVIFL